MLSVSHQRHFGGETETFGKRARQYPCSGVTSESVSDARHFETLTLSTTCKQCFIEKEQTLLLFKACISIAKGAFPGHLSAR